MDKYHITIRPEALQMLDLIYSNICNRSIDEFTAEGVISTIEKVIIKCVKNVMLMKIGLLRC